MFESVTMRLGSDVQKKVDDGWITVMPENVDEDDVIREYDGCAEWIVLSSPTHWPDGVICVDVRQCNVSISHNLSTFRNLNGTWSARMTYGGVPYLGEGDTDREAIAELTLAMGLLNEINVINKMAPDHDLHG